jgi:hypothetical protein
MFGSDEPVPMLLEAVVRLVAFAFRTAFRLIRLLIRRPRIASAGMAVVALDRYAGHLALVVLLGALVVGVRAELVNLVREFSGAPDDEIQRGLHRAADSLGDVQLLVMAAALDARRSA